MKPKRKIISLLLCAAMLLSLCPTSVFAEAAAQDSGIAIGASGLCEHHPEHDEGCGYTEGTPESPCTHEHSEDCYTLVKNCVHSHTEDCYPQETVSGNVAAPPDGEEREPENCAHICSEENGCITKSDCQHEHDRECGYATATEGTPCGFVCEDCAAASNSLISPLADNPPHNINDSPIEISDNAVCGNPCTGHTITGTGVETGNTITVTGGTHNITIENVNISTGDCAFSIANGADVKLTLSGTNTLKSGSRCAGLQVPNGATLTITETSDGSRLEATGGYYSAGIGGGYYSGCGNITIKGGVVTATGGDWSAGIGGSINSSGGTITIEGGTVTATGGGRGAGIGGGDGGSGGTITISGGTVTAIGGGSTGAGIGGGSKGSGGTITIEGGTVTATGGDWAAGIGGGNGRSGGTIIINGGNVTVRGADRATDIGNGRNGGPSEKIEISDNAIVTRPGDGGEAVIGKSHVADTTKWVKDDDNTHSRPCQVENCGQNHDFRTTTKTGHTLNDGNVDNSGNLVCACTEKCGYTKTYTCSGISVTTDPTNMTYTEGETLYLSGLEITANFTDTAETAKIAYPNGNMSFSIDNGTTLTTAHSGQKIKVTWYGKEAETKTQLTVNAADAETPKIAEQPQGTTYTVGNTAAPLRVTASVSDGGTLSYQWYSSTVNETTSGTAVSGVIDSGKTESTYTPPTTAEGTTYYYCVVTNTKGQKSATAVSNTAEIVVSPAAPTEYTITFDGNGGTSPAPQTTTGKKLTSLPTSNRSDYSFNGWYTATTGGDKITLDTVFSASVTVYAQWTKDTPPQPTEYTVTVNGSYAAASGEGSYEANKTVSIDAGSRSGYSFNGWTSSDGIGFANAGSPSTTFVMPGKNVTVTANWTKNSSGGGDTTPDYYTLTFETNGGSKIDTFRTSSYGKTVDLSDYTPTREGYDFNGWYADKALTEKITSIRLNGNKTVYAGWTKQAAPVDPADPDKENPSTGGSPFTDVKESDWFYDAVMFVYEKKIMVGTSDTTFSPYGTATRGMMAAIIWRMEGSPKAEYSGTLKDVPKDSYYAEAVKWTMQQGIFSGYGGGLFGPDDPITRQQLAAIFYNYAKYKGYDLTPTDSLSGFTDADKVSDWAQDAMKWAVGSGLMNGKGDGILDPQGTATRAEIAAMLHRFIEKYRLVEGVAPGGMTGWIDPRRTLSPQTGDNTNITLWAGMFLFSAMALAVTLYTIRRRDNDETPFPT